MRFVRLIVPLVVLIPALPGIAVAVLLFGTAQTMIGRVFATGLVAGAAALILGASVLATHRRRRKATFKLAVIHSIGFAGLMAICYAHSPDGRVPEGAAFRSEWGGAVGFERGRLGNLVPEVDQVAAALWLFPYIENAAPAESVERLGAALMRSYYALGGDRSFGAAASALPLSYDQRLGIEIEAEHRFCYIPNVGSGAGKLPVILFLHGDGGNLMAGVWNWQAFADSRGYAVIAPTRPTVDWDTDEGMAAIARALETIGTDERLDENRVVLAGYGTGAGGVPRASTEFAGAFERLVLISAKIPPTALRSWSLADQWKGRRVLFIHGDEDLRSPLAAVQEEAASLLAADVEVNLRVFPGEDQFLFWTRREDVFGLIED